MRTHHNLAAIASRHKDPSLMSIARALTAYIDANINEGHDESLYRTAHEDPILLGFILGRCWPACQDEVLAAIAADLEYDRMMVGVSPRAPVKVKGIDVSKLDFKL